MQGAGVGRSVRLLTAAIALLVFVLVAPSFAAGPVAACSCAAYTDDEALANADVVFEGRLVEIRQPDGQLASSDDPARFVFAVERVLKGTAFETQSVVSARDGASCGLELGTGATSLVFARTESSYDLADGELDSSLCSGTRSGVAPQGFGSPSAPTPGSSEIGSYRDNTVNLAVGAVVVVAAIVIAVLGVIRGRRARRAATS